MGSAAPTSSTTPPNPNVSLDQYGGRTNVTCAQATGWFHTEKVNNRWWLCTPNGHGFFFQGVAAWQTPLISKYNNNGCTAAAALISEFTSWDFNAVGELTYGYPEPIGSCSSNPKLPEIQTLTVSNYAAVNLWNYAQRPMKNLLWGLDGNYRGWRASIMDFFEPQFGIWLNGFFANDQSFLAYKASPYFVGVMLDDTDWFWGMGAGPDFHTVPIGHTNSHAGYIVLVTSPVQNFNVDPASRGVSELYTDAKVYSKTAMANPPANCSIQTPCSLRDYLFKKYNGNISALNSAWGSNYTTFDSTGTQVNGEVLGTGDGSTKVFTATLARTPVSPESVVIKVGGVAQGADCPSFQNCNVNTGGSITGPSGTTIAVGQQAWLSGLSGFPNNSFPALSMWAVVTYHFPSGSTQIATPSREVGTNFTIGNMQGVVTSPVNQASAATGYDVYVSCRLDISTTPALGCAGAGSPQPAEILQASNIPFGTNWAMPLTGLVSGTAIPAAPSTIVYTNGQIRITFSTAPASGQQITADYITGGWGYGTGLMDEDGRNTAWIGTNAVCLSPAASCDGSDNPLPNANANLAADLDAWVAQFSGEYFGTLNQHLKAAAPHMLYFGADTVGTWGVPPRKEILQGAAPYVDALFTNWFGNQPNVATGAAQYQYLSQYLGDKPLLNFLTLTASPDSAMAGFPDYLCCLYETTQAARGTQWNVIVNAELNTLSLNNSYQWVGAVWWGSHDFNGANGEHNNWGLKTPNDNAYDAHEAASGSVACSPPLQAYTCGGEPAPGGSAIRPFGDLLGGTTGVIAANQGWLTVQ